MKPIELCRYTLRKCMCDTGEITPERYIAEEVSKDIEKK